MLSTHMLCVHTLCTLRHSRGHTHSTPLAPIHTHQPPCGASRSPQPAEVTGGTSPQLFLPRCGSGGGGGEEPNTNSLLPLRKTLVWGGRGEESKVSFNCHPLPSILSWTLASLSEPINALAPPRLQQGSDGAPARRLREEGGDWEGCGRPARTSWGSYKAAVTVTTTHLRMTPSAATAQPELSWERGRHTPAAPLPTSGPKPLPATARSPSPPGREAPDSENSPSRGLPTWPPSQRPFGGRGRSGASAPGSAGRGLHPPGTADLRLPVPRPPLRRPSSREMPQPRLSPCGLNPNLQPTAPNRRTAPAHGGERAHEESALEDGSPEGA